ncbi:hypothetical protein C4G51_RS18630 [Vibrio parahaemolyticus]|nr:hypothetical protein [Vibrio parahaemolyticus]
MTDIFNSSDLVVENPHLEINNVNDMSDVEVQDTAFDDFSKMWAEENKFDRKSDSLGLEEPEFDESGHPIDLDDSEISDEDEYLEDEIEAHAKSVTEKELQEQMEQYESFASNFSELPDDLQFTVGDKTVTKSDLSALMNQSEQLNSAYTHIQEQIKRNQSLNTIMETQFHSAQTETNNMLQSVIKELQSPYLTDGQYAELHRQKASLEQRQNMLKQESMKYAQSKSQREQQQQQMKIATVSNQLERKYTPDQIKGAVQYGMDSGIPQEEMMSNASVPYFELLMKAKKYDDAIDKSKSNISNKTSAKSIKRNARKQVAQKKVSNAEQKASMMGSNQLSRQDEIDIFNSLID